MKIFGIIVVGLFLIGILLFGVGLVLTPRERAALRDQQSSTGQIRSQPTSKESAPAAEPHDRGAQSQPAGR